jgi:flagellar basal body P-ring formation protein FlgA
VKKISILIVAITMSFVQPAFALKCLKDLAGPRQPLQGLETQAHHSTHVLVNAEHVLSALQEAAVSTLSQEVDISVDPLGVFVPEGEDENLTLVSFTPNAAVTRFNAVFAFSGGQVSIRGKLSLMTQVPVLVRLPAPDAPIVVQDIEWKKVPVRQISRITLTKTQDILGCTLRSSGVALGSPLRRNDVARPVVVKRGDNVVIASQDAHISLEIQGTALENGELQQRIRVLNPMSKRTLNAVVVAPHQVQIERPIRLAQANEGRI